ncbi:MAG: 2-amino-3,7-dideoxy-D-threo-hept-6-ulosonate synthase [Firmicutes bacterium]|nr:2-amino-3,7-dideoxy-D-threo-hept-6-ulosonate synthase [Bacillota bacterium]
MKDIRKNKIFAEDGLTLIVAMDHGATMGPLPGMKDPGKIIASVVQGGADAIMTSYGIATRFGHLFKRVGLILRLDGGTSGLGDRSTGYMQAVYSVNDALRIGADGVVCMGFPGSRWEHHTLPYLSQIVADAHQWGMPVLVEALPRGFEPKEDARTVENIKTATRIAAELGADFIKTHYTGTVDSFREVIDSALVPVVVLGGSKMATDRDVLETVAQAMQAGARGIAMGRNIWQHPFPEKITRALRAIIHDGADVPTATEYLAS